MQLVSCASDGLVKVWNVKDEECAATLDGHEEKVRPSHFSSRFDFLRNGNLTNDVIDLGSRDWEG